MKYTDMRIDSKARTSSLFEAFIACTCTKPDGRVVKDYVLWIGQSKNALQLKDMADRAMDDLKARGHVERV